MITLAAIAFVTVLWSASTAVIFYLDSLPPRTFKYSMAAATLLLIACGAVIYWLRDETSAWAMAASFAAGLLAWGWTEMALYMGYLSGPRKHRCADDCAGISHFRHALEANLWHEIVVVLMAAAVWLSGNEVAAWCFIMLWLMHLSARINVFLGVRNVSADLVPPHMDVLKGFLRQRRMNPLFPFSCAALLALSAYLISLPQSFDATMAATLAVIGLLEHALLMLPLPIDRMWNWALARRAGPEDQPNPETETRHRTAGALS